MKYKKGDLVWLQPFENEPRQQAHVLSGEVNGTYDVSLHGVVLESDDNGLREVPSEQIEGLVK